MLGSTASSSNLQICIEPSQSSFFAGEDFTCTITFTNTLPPVPQSVPLPSTSTFESVSDVNRRAISLGPNALQLKPSSSPRLASPTAGSFPQHIRHGKSQSMDLRTFTRRNQLQSTGDGEEDVGTDEIYYRNIIEERERDFDEGRDQYLHQEVLGNLPTRRKLIGKSLQNGIYKKSGLGGSREKPSMSTPGKMHAKALSVAVPSQYHQHHDKLGLGPQPGNQLESPQRTPSKHITIQANAPSPTASRNVSTSSVRQPSGTIAANHPHSRKKSVAQVQSEDLSATFELEGDALTPSNSSTPRESLDIRTTASHGKGDRFYSLGENSTMESVLREDFTQWSKTGKARERSDSAATTSKVNGGERSRSLLDADQAKPGVETLLWSFAQFGGTFEIDESLIKPGEFEQVKAKLIGRGGAFSGVSNASMSAVGGGTLGAGADQNESSKEGWGSYLRSALSMGSGRSALSVPNGSHRRTSSSLEDVRAKTLTSKSIPIFSNPPSMVAVDLSLAPGESRSYTFRLALPPDLPPSYAGRAISFSYTLTLGTNRLVKMRKGGTEQKSRLVRIPLRVYNLVNISGVTSFFDLTNPIINLKDLAETKEEEEGSVLSSLIKKVDIQNGLTQPLSGDTKRRKSRSGDLRRDHDLVQYTEKLMASCKSEADDEVPTDVEVAIEQARSRARSTGEDHDNGGARPTSPRTRSHLQLLPDLIAIKSGQTASSSLDPSTGLGLSLAEEDDLPKSSLQAVEILSRNSPKVAYDISRDGQIAAVLTLVKSKYRLGDTVHGVVTMNEADCKAKVVRIASTLESHEEIEATLCTVPSTRAQKITRKVHAESHENTLDSGRVTFTLPIPSGATPDFITSAVKLAWTVRLSFLMLSTVKRKRKPSAPGQKPSEKVEGGNEREDDDDDDRTPRHLVSGIDDGYSIYHRSYRAAGHLSRTFLASGEERQTKLEVVECAVPLTVLPHSTRFTAGQIALTV